MPYPWLGIGQACGPYNKCVNFNPCAGNKIFRSVLNYDFNKHFKDYFDIPLRLSPSYWIPLNKIDMV